MRREVAERYGCGKGERRPIVCAYCDEIIIIDRTTKRTRFLNLWGRSTPELDHVIPLAVGGPHTADNLVPACMNCNRAKGPRPLISSAERSAFAVRPAQAPQGFRR